MNPVRIIWLIVAMLLMSYVSVGYVLGKRSEAATFQDVIALKTAFAQMKFRIVSTRKIVFWDALNMQTVTCYVFTPLPNQSTPPTGQGWYSAQWVLTTSTVVMSEDQCYAQQ